MADKVVHVPSVITTGLLVVSAVFPALSLLSICLRWAARRKIKHGWRSDDWFISVTWIITLGISIAVWAFTPHVGIDYIKPPFLERDQQSAKFVLSLTLIMNAALATVKISVLLFYKRIFATPKFTIASWIGIVVVGLWGILTVLLQAIVADPISSAWTGFGSYRMNPVVLSETRAVSSLVLDIAILLFPLPKVLRLHVSLKRKINVALIFALGGFCCIAAAVRLALVVQNVELGTASQASGYSALSRESQTVIWCIIEPNCSIIAASLPCYGTLVRGRTPGSIIRSVRFILCLRSRSSNDSRCLQRGTGLDPYGGRGDGLGKPMKTSKEIIESEIELTDIGGLGNSSGEVGKACAECGGGRHVAHVDDNPGAYNGCFSDPNIEVIRTCSTTSSDVV